MYMRFSLYLLTGLVFCLCPAVVPQADNTFDVKGHHPRVDDEDVYSNDLFSGSGSSELTSSSDKVFRALPPQNGEVTTTHGVTSGMDVITFGDLVSNSTSAHDVSRAARSQCPCVAVVGLACVVLAATAVRGG
ncbi:uncharacterized protein LOC143279569 [Babylonia areolata]|uniref:uncharacterized protein LOC143279569 n=1 Tax=Babylonia areolata TaxID=304850 RepID=UPI003FCFC364